MEYKIPEPMIEEHEGLHADLVRVINSGGRTGAAAQAVADLLHPHFEKEEAFAIPPLGLLALLARGEFTPEMTEVLALTDTLKVRLSEMLADHAVILKALDQLRAAAREEDKPDAASFADDLSLHARTEEEIAYPTSLLIGEHVRLKAAALDPVH